MKDKICLILKRPAHYRESIHKLIDREYNCDWYFGNTDASIKSYNINDLKHAKYLPILFERKSFYYTKGFISLLFNKEYNTFLTTGATRDIASLLFVFFKRLFFPKKKLYFWCHGWYGKESKFEAFIKDFMFHSANGIFCYGEYAKNMLISRGYDEKKVHAIHNSLHYDEQKRIREELSKSNIYSEHFGNTNAVLLFIGRLTKIKQLDMIIRSIANLKEKGYSYNVVFIGDGEEKEYLEKLAIRLHVENNTWFYGACYDEYENANLIFNADLCVAPGNVGLTAMHTMVFGTPVITHNDFKWQMPEFEAIVEDKTGSFFERNNQVSLDKAISQWFNNKGNQREIVRKDCMEEIDGRWTPYFQIKIIRKYLV